MKRYFISGSSEHRWQVVLDTETGEAVQTHNRDGSERSNQTVLTNGGLDIERIVAKGLWIEVRKVAQLEDLPQTAGDAW